MGAAAPWLVPGITATIGLIALLWSLPQGLDLTDEGYYLTEIAHPGDTTATALLFGWTWHSMYGVTGGSVVGLRLVAITVVTALSVALCLAVLRLQASEAPPARAAVACLAAVTAALAFVPLSVIPTTPSYNTLAWVSLAMAALGCALAWSHWRPVLGGALVGLAGFVAVTAKPTTALLLGLSVLATTPWRRMGRRPVVAAIVALVVPSVLLVLFVPGHLHGLVDIVSRGVDATVGHADLVRWDVYPRHWQVLLPLASAGLGGAAAGLLSQRRHPAAATVLGGVSVAAALVSLFVWWRRGTIADVDLMMPYGAVAGFGVLGLVAIGATRARARPGRTDVVVVRLAVLLASLPAAYAFGTNNNLWLWIGQVVVFWFLAIVLLVGTTGPVAAAAGALAAYVALVAAVITPLDPYRSGPLIDTEVTQVSLSGVTLRLPPDEARAVTELLAVGERLGVTRDTRVLDLTGLSPGVVWAWGAQPLASGWVLGGYVESLGAARTAIAPARCELPRALVLWEPGQRRAITDDVLAPWGVRVPDDYRAVATFPRISVPATLAEPNATVTTVTVLEPVSVSVPGCPQL
ncbi:hypothetical protein [Knoellia aerolata]|uniref:hypothetical protein n=1 Tax=Knoellia aerolata TaxID=442954 RepID=UPI000B17D247|nr:hypothetical protein [Knoellia aerolata]